MIREMQWCWLGRYKKGAMSQGRWVTSRSATPILFGTRYQFCERQVFHGPRWEGDGFGIILMSSLQPRSFSCTVLSRVPTSLRIYCCHWSYRRWNAGANERDGRACKYRWSLAYPLATHLLLCGQFLPGHGLVLVCSPGSWGPLL